MLNAIQCYVTIPGTLSDNAGTLSDNAGTLSDNAGKAGNGGSGGSGGAGAGGAGKPYKAPLQGWNQAGRVGQPYYIKGL